MTLKAEKRARRAAEAAAAVNPPGGPWRCRMVPHPPLHEYGGIDTSGLQIGDMFFVERPDDELHKLRLTQQYWNETAKQRKPLYVALPLRWHDGRVGVSLFLVDQQCYSGKGGKGYYDGWRVTGAPPRITVHPSINMVGQYHGWLKDGVISRDVDGRQF